MKQKVHEKGERVPPGKVKGGGLGKSSCLKVKRRLLILDGGSSTSRIVNGRGGHLARGKKNGKKGVALVLPGEGEACPSLPKAGHRDARGRPEAGRKGFLHNKEGGGGGKVFGQPASNLSGKD